MIVGRFAESCSLGPWRGTEGASRPKGPRFPGGRGVGSWPPAEPSSLARGPPPRAQRQSRPELGDSSGALPAPPDTRIPLRELGPAPGPVQPPGALSASGKQQAPEPCWWLFRANSSASSQVGGTGAVGWPLAGQGVSGGDEGRGHADSRLFSMSRRGWRRRPQLSSVERSAVASAVAPPLPPCAVGWVSG